MHKISLLIGFAVGYVVGTASGRQQFEKIKATVQDVLDRPEVKSAVKKVDDFVGEKAPALRDVAGAVADSGSSTSSSGAKHSGSGSGSGSSSASSSGTSPSGTGASS